jgi:hypothetical protein
MPRARLLTGLLPILVAGILSVGFAAAAPPPGKGQPPKHHDSVSVGIAYSHGALVLSSEQAGRAQVVIRSADGRRHWLKTVKLQVPTTSLPLKKVFPHITSGRYRVVVRPLFDNGFLSGAWIVVH